MPAWPALGVAVLACLSIALGLCGWRRHRSRSRSEGVRAGGDDHVTAGGDPLVPDGGNARLRRRDAVVESVREGVVVVDRDGEVTDVNPVVESLVDDDRERLVGRSIEAVLSPVLDGVDTGCLQSVTDLDGEVVAVDDNWFELWVSPLSETSDGPAGHVLTLRDVTERRAREQRLQVMNRLLRHNFRNEVTVVHGFADMLDERLDGREGEMAARVHETAAELVERVEKASSLERVTRRAEQDPDAVDVERVVADVVAETRRVHDARFEVETDSDGPVVARAVLETVEMVLRNLLENAVEHSDIPRPTVTITLRRASDAVEFAVADDGPGLPDHERAVLEAGHESDLKHGSGLGLWLVHWGVRALDGEVSFEENQPRGTVVRVRLPAADPETAGVVRPREGSRVGDRKTSFDADVDTGPGERGD